MTSDRPRRTVAVLSAGALFGAPLLAACTANPPSGSSTPGATSDARHLTVAATDTTCAVSASMAPSGSLRFSVTNGGSKVTEFYLLGADGVKVLGEIENIGPGISRDLVVTVAPGSYFTACKPGMAGKGIRSSFTVSNSGASLTSGDDQALIDRADERYART